MLTVKDIMQSDVVTVTSDANARHLARLLADEEISGVPVLDTSGALVGVVSSTDLVRLAAEDSGIAVRPVRVGVDPIGDPDADEDDEYAAYGFFLPEDSPFSGQRLLQDWSDGPFDSVTVGDIMTPISFSVRQDTPVSELCDFLVRGRIHRAVVADGEELVGIVTSADVLRAVAEGDVGV